MEPLKLLSALASLSMLAMIPSANAAQRYVAPKPAFKPGINSSLAASQRPSQFAPSANAGRLVTDNGAGLMRNNSGIISRDGAGFRR